MDSSVKYGTAIVLVHLGTNLVHGAAHHQLHVGLSPAEMFFVLGVILVAPLIAMTLLWTSRRPLGLALLVLSMAASLVFGVYKHFLAVGPDRVGEQPHGPWATVFLVTACLLLLAEGAGAWVGFFFLHRALAQDASRSCGR